MIDRADILDFVDRVAERFKPIRVILFGSYAYGEPNEDSDVDILVIMRHRTTTVTAGVRILLACPRTFPMDLLVRSPAALRKRLAMGDYFFEEVVAKGIVLYEADNPRVGRQGRSRLRRRFGNAKVAQEAHA